MGNRVLHFEIHASDMARAQEFYTEVFGWKFEDWTKFAGMPYFGITTGEDSEPGINGGLMQRRGEAPTDTSAVNGGVLTVGVDDYDAAHEKILAAGGVATVPKYALPGMAWQGYYKDTEGNIFGIHQPDEKAA